MRTSPAAPMAMPTLAPVLRPPLDSDVATVPAAPPKKSPGVADVVEFDPDLVGVAKVGRLSEEVENRLSKEELGVGEGETEIGP
jgi:hypothetical protein